MKRFRVLFVLFLLYLTLTSSVYSKDISLEVFELQEYFDISFSVTDHQGRGSVSLGIEVSPDVDLDYTVTLLMAGSLSRDNMPTGFEVTQVELDSNIFGETITPVGAISRNIHAGEVLSTLLTITEVDPDFNSSYVLVRARSANGQVSEQVMYIDQVDGSLYTTQVGVETLSALATFGEDPSKEYQPDVRTHPYNILYASATETTWSTSDWSVENQMRVSGTVNYVDLRGVQHPVRNAQVYVMNWTSDELTFAGETRTDSNGYYESVLEFGLYSPCTSKCHVVVEVLTTRFENFDDAYQGAVANWTLKAIPQADTVDIYNPNTYLGFEPGTDLHIDMVSKAGTALNSALVLNDAMRFANDYMNEYVDARGSDFFEPTFVYPANSSEDRSRYANREIPVAVSDRYDWDMLHRLYGQYILEALPGYTGGYQSTVEQEQFSLLCFYDPQHTILTVHEPWSQGWGTFFAMSLQKELQLQGFPLVNDGNFEDMDLSGNPGLTRSIDDPSSFGAEADPWSVAGFLWDEYMKGEAEYIFLDLISDHAPVTFIDFWERYFEKYGDPNKHDFFARLEFGESLEQNSIGIRAGSLEATLTNGEQVQVSWQPSMDCGDVETWSPEFRVTVYDSEAQTVLTQSDWTDSLSLDVEIETDVNVDAVMVAVESRYRSTEDNVRGHYVSAGVNLE